MADPQVKSTEMLPQPDNAQAAPIPPPQEAPDPDSDDLDDLDDMLDEFSATSLSNPPPASSGPGRPHSSNTTTDSTNASTQDKPARDEIAADFSAELQKEMAALMGEIDESPEMRKQLDEMMTSLNTGAAHKPPTTEKGSDVGGSASKTEGGAASGPDEAFTETIRKTMERMQASGEQASAAAAASEGGEEDMLAQLLKEMAVGGGGEGGEEDFSKMLLGMMEQLTNKEILYEPMKELHDKFPTWMEKNEGKTKAEDMVRYKEQQGLVREIVGRFERKGYSDENAGDREFIVERMQKMQAAGSPPADLVGDMKDAQEALGDLDTGCAQQ